MQGADEAIRLTETAWFQWLAVIAAVGAAAAAFHRWVYAPGRALLRQILDFLEDWNGRPARPGDAGRPGAMQRLEQLENNGGSSMKDTVERTAAKLDELSRSFEEHRADHARERESSKRAEGAQWAAIRDQAAALRELAPAAAGGDGQEST